MEYRRVSPAIRGKDRAPGWEAIDERLRPIYGDREPDWHSAAVPHFAVGGEAPLDGISIYARRDDAIPHLHFVSNGMSELYYNDDAFGKDFSKFGCEFTLRLAMDKDSIPFPPGRPPTWPINLMQNLARYVFRSGNWFEAGHYIDAKGPIAMDSETILTAVALTLDPELGSIATPHGKVDFLQIVGLATEEFAAITQGQFMPDDIVRRLKDGNPLRATDLARKPINLK